MNKKLARFIGTAAILALWLAVAAFAWFKEPQAFTLAERRDLAQFPTVNADTVFGGSFMEDFEDYSLDQFPLRDTFRGIKARFHTYILGQKDNNGYFYHNGYLAVQDSTLDQEAVNKKLEILAQINEKYLQNANCYLAIVPDKGYYLSQEMGAPALDYDQVLGMMQAALPNAAYIDITGTLDLTDYYRTDTHWRQESLIPTAAALAQAMGVEGPKAENFTPVKQDLDFYGVYYLQAALPAEPDELYIMESPIFQDLTIQVDGAPVDGVYDFSQLTGDDPYNIFMQGAKKGFVTITNPNATTDRNLVVFRDSFGSSIAPLLIQDYKTVTLVDLRVMNRMILGMVDFQNTDVLFLYSTLALNNADEGFM